MRLEQGKSRYYPFQVISAHVDEIQKQAMAAQRLEAQSRTRYQSAVRTSSSGSGCTTSSRTPWRSRAPRAFRRSSRRREGRTPRSGKPSSSTPPSSGPPPAAGAAPEAWRSVGQALAGVSAGQRDPPLKGWARVGEAWVSQDASRFNEAVSSLEPRGGRLAQGRSPGREGDRLQPRTALHPGDHPLRPGAPRRLHLLALQAPDLRPSAFVLLLAGALVHTSGLVARIVLEGRPPVTNLYSSAIFVGWVGVVVGLVLESLGQHGAGRGDKGALR